jgi:transcription elongation factor Elf1
MKKTHRKNTPYRNQFKCPNCKRGFMMDWALKNHIKHCVDGK